MFGAAAATHVETVGGPSGLEQLMGETLGIASLAGTFQAVDHDYFGYRRAGGPLRMNENADVGLGVIKFDFHGEAFGIQRTTPVISRDGNEMGILEERDECCQNTILMVLGFKGFEAEKRKGRTRRPP